MSPGRSIVFRNCFVTLRPSRDSPITTVRCRQASPTDWVVRPLTREPSVTTHSTMVKPSLSVRKISSRLLSEKSNCTAVRNSSKASGTAFKTRASPASKAMFFAVP